MRGVGKVGNRLVRLANGARAHLGTAAERGAGRGRRRQVERRLRQRESTTGLTIVGARTGGGDGGRSAAAHCIAARHKARASRGDRAPPDGFVASSRPSRALRGRQIHPPIHGEASRPDRRRPGGRWLCLGWLRGRRWAAMHTYSTRAFVTRNPGRTRGLALHRTAHEHKDRCRQAEAMLEAMCICKRRAT